MWHVWFINNYEGQTCLHTTQQLARVGIVQFLGDAAGRVTVRRHHEQLDPRKVRWDVFKTPESRGNAHTRPNKSTCTDNTDTRKREKVRGDMYLHKGR